MLRLGASWSRTFFVPLACCASVSLASEPYVQRSEVQAYIDELVQTHQFSRKALEGVFSQAKRQDRIIELMSRQRNVVWSGTSTAKFWSTSPELVRA